MAESLRGLGSAKVSTRTKDKVVVAVVIPREAKKLPEERCSCWNFFGGWWGLFFAGGFGESGWLDVVFLW
jgi:hypothetical protein